MVSMLWTIAVAQERADFLRFDPQGVVDRTDFELSVVSRSADELVLRLSVPGVFYQDQQAQDREFKRLYLPGEGMTQQVGLPELPLIRERLEVPAGVSIGVRLIEADHGVISGIVPWPFQAPLLEGQQAASFDFDEQAYAVAGLYPAQLIEVSEVGQMRGTSVVTISFAPLRYDAAKGELQTTRSATFALTFEYGQDPGNDADPAAQTAKPSCR
ncbi:MAG: C25 family peptidase propeptide domain-containing protein [Candidatus Alcyoniella australis]|nr:C25 family peptidase propeptide domain-containing protein [Candidatus Alcyoniella australis]